MVSSARYIKIQILPLNLKVIRTDEFDDVAQVNETVIRIRARSIKDRGRPCPGNGWVRPVVCEHRVIPCSGRTAIFEFPATGAGPIILHNRLAPTEIGCP